MRILHSFPRPAELEDARPALLEDVLQPKVKVFENSMLLVVWLLLPKAGRGIKGSPGVGLTFD
jgi:hypothetical protein